MKIRLHVQGFFFSLPLSVRKIQNATKRMQREKIGSQRHTGRLLMIYKARGQDGWKNLVTFVLKLAVPLLVCNKYRGESFNQTFPFLFIQ